MFEHIKEIENNDSIFIEVFLTKFCRINHFERLRFANVFYMF